MSVAMGAFGPAHRPLNVLFVRNARGIVDVTGAESYLFNLITALQRIGARCLLAASIRPDLPDPPWLTEIERRELPHVTIPVSSKFGLADLATVRKLARSFGADVVHGLDHRADLIALLAACEAGVPAVASFFGWTNWERDSLKGRLYAWIDRRIQSRLDAVIVDSADVGRHADWGERGASLLIVPNGVDTQRFDPARPMEDLKPLLVGRSDVFVFSMVGRIHPNKGQVEFVRAAHALLGRYPDTRFLIVGDAPRGYEPYKQEVVDLIRALGVGREVLVTNVPSAQVPAVLASTDVLMAPSHLESFSFALLEAMAMARPVLTTDVGGNREMMTHGESGLLVPAGDVPALVSAAGRLIEDPALRRALGQAARKRVLAEYGVDTMAARTAAVYREIIGWRAHRQGSRAELRERLERARQLRPGVPV